jgi:hypothetical protein
MFLIWTEHFFNKIESSEKSQGQQLTITHQGHMHAQNIPIVLLKGNRQHHDLHKHRQAVKTGYLQMIPLETMLCHC